MPERRVAKKTDEARLAKPAAPQTTQRGAAPVSSAPPATVARTVDPAELSAASPEQVRQLHRQVGNRALNRLLAAKTIQAKLTVGPADDRYEREADQAADAVMRVAAAPAAGQPGPGDEPVQRQPVEDDEALQRQAEEEDEALQRFPAAAPSVGLEGGDAGTAIEAQLAANRGAGAPLPEATRAKMEAGLGADFSSVRIHTGAEAANLNQSLGAQAFTHGADVYMGAGKYAPGSSDGQHLLAHELTHVVQQGASTVRRRSAAGPLTEQTDDGVIHRKLSGTTGALEALGGEASLKSKAKAKLASVKSLVGKSTTAEGSGKYAQLLSKLAAYETREANLAQQNQMFLTGKVKAELVGALKDMEQLVVAWLAENADLGTNADDARTKVQNMDSDTIVSQESLEQKRYHALKLLLPRLRHEMMEISRDDFYRTATFSDRRLNSAKTQDDAFGGAVNRLDKVTHGGETGVFTQDRTWADSLTVGNTLGISAVDPNAGARSVAMYQLAQLLNLGVDVIAKTEFATHTSTTNRKDSKLAAPMAKMGVRQALAPGREAAQTTTAITDRAARQQGGDTISLEDPTLQRSLNAIQLIDAIAGQIDRHWHNYYIATDGEGRVQGVVGIDLDMAFAPDHRTVAPATEDFNDPLRGSHFVGLPHLVDSQFATRIVAVSADQVGKLLRNYLTDDEVNAALERFRLVQEACQGILERREAVLPGGWGAETARAQLAGPNTSYLNKMAAGVTKHSFATPAQEEAKARVKDAEGRRGVYAIIDNLERLIWSNILTAAESLDLVGKIIVNFNAAAPNEQRPLIHDLTNTPISNWNTYLHRPAVDPGVLLRARAAEGR